MALNASFLVMPWYSWWGIIIGFFVAKIIFVWFAIKS
jgi:hypothetical protein